MTYTKLPPVNENKTLPLPHFPNRFYAAVFRFWETVDVTRIAAALYVSEAEIREAAAEMGLPVQRYTDRWQARGYITTMCDEHGRKCVEELVRGVGVTLFPVGRLDRDSEGLLLMTNDGDFANAVIHPASHLPKLYRVTLRSPMTDEQKLKFEEGIMLDGRMTAPAQVRIVSSEKERCVVEITLFEGRNRQIRRMCEMLGLEVARLRRNAIGSVKLGMLPNGSWRYLTPFEVQKLVMATGSTKKIAAAYIKNGREPDRDYHNARR